MGAILLAFLAVSVAVETAVFQKLGRRFGSKIWETALMILLINIVAVTTAKAFGIIEKSSLEGFSMIRMTGAILSMPVFFWMACKVRKWPIAEAFDVLTIAFVVGYAIMRLSCFIQGCCFGMWISSIGIRVPIREMELLLFAVFLIRYTPKVGGQLTHGTAYPILLMWYGIYRFFAEWFRVEYCQAFGIFHWAHIWSILMLIIGLSVYGEVEQKQRERVQKPKRRKTHV